MQPLRRRLAPARREPPRRPLRVPAGVGREAPRPGRGRRRRASAGPYLKKGSYPFFSGPTTEKGVRPLFQLLQHASPQLIVGIALRVPVTVKVIPLVRMRADARIQLVGEILRRRFD